MSLTSSTLCVESIKQIKKTGRYRKSKRVGIYLKTKFMKKFILFAVIALSSNLLFSQSASKSLVGMYESIGGSDWVSLKENGTGKMCIYNSFMNLGCKSISWTSDDDQIFIKYVDETGYEDSKWCYWANSGGSVRLSFPTMASNIDFRRK